MLFKGVDIEKILIKEKDKIGYNSTLISFAQEILNDKEHFDQFTAVNKLLINELEADKIYHISQIEKICISYRLRFLDSNYYKLEIPPETINKIKKLERIHKTSLHSFKIIATAEALKLKNYDDPLLFIPIGNDYYYLIHKWGNDLSRFRKWMVLPYKNLEYLIFFIFLISLLTTFILPYKNLGNVSYNTVKLVTFLFIFKMYCAIFIYYFFWKGKQFSITNWDDIYYN
ncbi:hypothetical protein [Flavobacterium sp. H122]|uniref:hypothetical protein n=1 Tax=Flavobacterium sp. H122 TaxID=2529860 RepID=UPI0010AAE6C0|nr:hypothetical protein [Flavobacterium sp. H122]